MDLPIGLAELARTGRLTAADDWGPLAQTGVPYADFAAAWRGASAAPTEQELIDAYTAALVFNAAAQAEREREAARQLVQFLSTPEGRAFRADVVLTINQLNVLRRQVVGGAAAVWDPASIANGAGLTSPPLTVAGAVFGDAVDVAAPYSLQGLVAVGYVDAPDTVRVRLHNGTGAAINLASGTWKVAVRRPEVMAPIDKADALQQFVGQITGDA